MNRSPQDYETPGGKLERLLLSWGLPALGCVVTAYGLFGIATGKIIAESYGTWSLLGRGDARVYGGLMTLVGIILVIVGRRAN